MTPPVKSTASNSTTIIPVGQIVAPIAVGTEPTVPPAAPVSSSPKPKIAPQLKKKLVWAAIAAAIVMIGVVIYFVLKPSGPGKGFVSGNGRIEATEIDVATKLAGRVQSIMVDEGDFVQVGEPLAQMQTDVLDAQRAEAQAQSQQAITTVASAEAQVAARQSDTAVAQATVSQRAAELDAAQRRFARTQMLSTNGVVTSQQVDDDRASLHGTEAAVTAAQAEVTAAQAAIKAAQAQVVGANAGVTASAAAIATIDADITDSLLKSACEGRVQYRVAQPGEVLGAGGTVLNLVDLNDVYLTFFLSDAVAGKVAIGTEVHLVLDAAPQDVIPARVSFVATVAQFTPKTVETTDERQKLMFRVKAQINRALLQKNLKQIKTGLPGVAWIKLDAAAKWPANLEIKAPQ
jgi:HlyD family secretion protein